MSHYDVVVVGAGHAGTQLVFALTAGGFTGSVALIGDEVATPYERPPLTKGYLADETLSEDLAFRSESWWAGSNVERHLGRRREFWRWLLSGWRRDGLLPAA